MAKEIFLIEMEPFGMDLIRLPSKSSKMGSRRQRPKSGKNDENRVLFGRKAIDMASLSSFFTV